ncbi:MAG: phage head morphogenesis protein [Treponema sp.]|nr:phage head morphogenesis protein [Treponema sp.]
MADKLIPKQALDYIKNKKLHPAFSYKDVWNEEHATAFTVAKAMQLDVLSDIKTAVEKAIENGTTFEQFKKDLKPTLIQKGWWGKREMTDPLTGETVNAQLGSDRRLRTIYSTNLRSAYQKGQYDRTMASEAHPYLMYRIGASVHHREQHLKWNNLILPKDDPLWNSIFPPNGYGCKCYTVAVTEARKQKYEQSGVPYYDNWEHKTVRQPAQTTAPRMTYDVYENVRKGIVERIPKGITPGFNWNQGKADRVFSSAQALAKKFTVSMNDSNSEFLKSIAGDRIFRANFQGFVDKSFNGTHKGHEITAAGFLDNAVVQWLRKNVGIDVGTNTVIGLESRLIKGIKATRHGIQKTDAEILLDTMLNGKVYWLNDGNGNRIKDGLLYLFPVNENEWFRIAVRPQTIVSGIAAPFIRSVGYLPNATVEDMMKWLIEIK